MESKKLLVVHDQCAACDYVKGRLVEKGVDFEIIDASTKEGNEIADRLGILTVPNCAVVIKDGDKESIRPCTEEELEEFIREIV